MRLVVVRQFVLPRQWQRGVERGGARQVFGEYGVVLVRRPRRGVRGAVEEIVRLHRALVAETRARSRNCARPRGRGVTRTVRFPSSAPCAAAARAPTQTTILITLSDAPLVVTTTSFVAGSAEPFAMSGTASPDAAA